MEDLTTWQDTATAIGTLVAVLVSVGVAMFEIARSGNANRKRQQAERIATAGLVAAWVEDEYVPNDDGTVYIRRAKVHLANEANEPVFRVTVSVGVGFKTRSIGPLSVPAPIPVLPPRRSLSWDITLPLQAHDDTESPCAEMGFTDSSNRRWLRKFDGSLVETTGKTSQLMDSGDEGGADGQIGRPADPGNPMVMAMAFLGLVEDPEIDLDLMRQVLAPEAKGWEDMDEADFASLKHDLSDFGFGGFVSYPAPHVAYVKIIPQTTSRRVVAGGDQVQVEAKIITLTYLPGRGWRVFSYGPPTEADRILFPEGSLFVN